MGWELLYVAQQGRVRDQFPAAVGVIFMELISVTPMIKTIYIQLATIRFDVPTHLQW